MTATKRLYMSTPLWSCMICNGGLCGHATLAMMVIKLFSCSVSLPLYIPPSLSLIQFFLACCQRHRLTVNAYSITGLLRQDAGWLVAS